MPENAGFFNISTAKHIDCSLLVSDFDTKKDFKSFL